MTNENYQKCRTCRFCIHSGDAWVCVITNKPTGKESTCERYRPGSCENCNHIKKNALGAMCTITHEETDILSVCSYYDPSGKRSV